jgi:Na+/citrate or Na+/malate symporter
MRFKLLIFVLHLLFGVMGKRIPLIELVCDTILSLSSPTILTFELWVVLIVSAINPD